MLASTQTQSGSESWIFEVCLNDVAFLTYFCRFRLSKQVKYESILLLASSILVGRIRILKYDIFWLGVFGVFRKSRILAQVRQNTTIICIFKYQLAYFGVLKVCHSITPIYRSLLIYCNRGLVGLFINNNWILEYLTNIWHGIWPRIDANYRPSQVIRPSLLFSEK